MPAGNVCGPLVGVFAYVGDIKASAEVLEKLAFGKVYFFNFD
jgi:hypothetical protein